MWEEGGRRGVSNNRLVPMYQSTSLYPFSFEHKRSPSPGTYRVRKTVMTFTFTIKISNKEWPPRPSTTSQNLAATTHNQPQPIAWSLNFSTTTHDRPRPAITSPPPLRTTDKTNHRLAVTTHGFERYCKINCSKAIFKRL